MEGCPVALAARRYRQPAVGTAIERVRGSMPALIGVDDKRLAHGVVLQVHVRHGKKSRADLRTLEVLSLPGSIAMPQRGQHRGGARQGAAKVHMRHVMKGRPAWPASTREQSCNRH